MATTSRSEKLDLRLSVEDKQKLIAAAAAEERTLSDFVLRSALERANETLPDRRLFLLNPTQWQAFLDALDAPPRELPRIARLFREPSVLELGEVE
ncbi:MAG TPA: DUF1778 domain-containing protein [Thermomicrobiales bacterium]|nr:DUF1778 domain-containing protein [Thermomicrobiales bacterium]